MAAAQIVRNIAHVHERIAEAASRVGRSAEAITLVAVTKTVPPVRIAEAYAAGVRDFGENYIQEALAKMDVPPLDKRDVHWHYIGHLQRNKAREVVGQFALVHSVDSLALATEIGRRAQRADRMVDLLLEVKLDPREARFGLAPEAALEIAAQVQQLEGVRLCGLMGMAPHAPDPEAARPYFRRLHTLFTQLPSAARQTLSMGMSGDFEIAVEEGATHVRIGTAIFGAR